MARVTDAIIVAAGRGMRAQRDDLLTPKQYVDLGGAAVLSHSVRRFIASDLVARVVVVIHPDDAGEFEALGFSGAGMAPSPTDKLLPPVLGGATRQNQF